MRNIIGFIQKHKNYLLYFGVILILYFASAVHESYPDEMDNISGGYFITKGLLPYTGFFTHHGPLSYYLAGIITLFSKQSFVTFRFLSAILFFLSSFGTYYFLKKYLGKVEFFLFYIGVLAVGATYFWGHMFLADPISGYLLIPAYALLFIKIFRKELLQKTDLIIISILSSLCVINSPTYLYAVSVLVFCTFLQTFDFNKKIVSKNSIFLIGKFILIFAIPYLIFLLFLILTGSLQDYLFQALTYNKNYYIYNYPRPSGSTAVNPIRYAIVIFNNFFNAYYVLFAGIKNVDFINPYNVTLALTNLSLWAYMTITRNYKILFLSLLSIILVNVRSNPLDSKVTDYQASVYFMLTFFHASFFIYLMRESFLLSKFTFAKIFFTVLGVLFSIYWFFTLLFLSKHLWNMTYLRYMGEMPLIYDRPQVARVINDVIPADHYCWVGPFEFEEMLNLNCKLPSRFHIFRRFFEQIEPFKKEILHDYSTNRADVMVYNRLVFGIYYEDEFFTDAILDKYYVKVGDIPEGPYEFVDPQKKDYNLNDMFYIERSKISEIIPKLLNKGHIRVKSL